MSELKTQIHSVKGETVFMILYNYSDCDYSIIKIMEKAEDAYKYICLQESSECNKTDLFHKKMISVNKPEDINKYMESNLLYICYISSGKYNKFNLCDYCNISSYVIIPMVIS